MIPADEVKEKMIFRVKKFNKNTIPPSWSNMENMEDSMNTLITTRIVGGSYNNYVNMLIVENGFIYTNHDLVKANTIQ